MSDVNSALYANAIKCMELLHRLLLAWLLLALIVAYLPVGSGSTAIRLPFADVSVPVDSARWSCGTVIFLMGFAGSAVLKNLAEICSRLAGSTHLQAVVTYPSIATTGATYQRFLLGLGLALVQAITGSAVFPPNIEIFGFQPGAALSFVFSLPMIWFATDLRDWQKVLKIDRP